MKMMMRIQFSELSLQEKDLQKSYVKREEVESLVSEKIQH